MSPNLATTLGIEDLQAAVLHPRPTPYAGTLILVRVDDRRHGRRLVRRLIPPSRPLVWDRSVNPGGLWRSPPKGGELWACRRKVSPPSR